ncbi:MAG: hypothetical protein ABW095_13460, partial [Candidatus Thiodiazotropha sp.]
NDWTSRSDAIFGSPLAPTARRVSSIASRLQGTNRLGFQPSLALSDRSAATDSGIRVVEITQACTRQENFVEQTQFPYNYAF